METDFYLPLRARTRIAFCRLFALALFLATCGGCALVGQRNEWNPPAPYSPNVLFGSSDPRLAGAEAQIAAGREAEAACNAVCINHYFAAATEAWPYHVECAGSVEETPASELYRSAVRSFI
jgi:hypothetical protein